MSGSPISVPSNRSYEDLPQLPYETSGKSLSGGLSVTGARCVTHSPIGALWLMRQTALLAWSEPSSIMPPVLVTRGDDFMPRRLAIQDLPELELVWIRISLRLDPAPRGTLVVVPFRSACRRLERDSRIERHSNGLKLEIRATPIDATSRAQ